VTLEINEINFNSSINYVMNTKSYPELHASHNLQNFTFAVTTAKVKSEAAPTYYEQN
jgi:hypothetical protein